MNIRYLLIAMVSFGLTACSVIDVVSDFDPEYDYSKLKTYSWVTNPNSSKGQELIEKHFQRTMADALAKKGMTLSDTDPDFRIAYHGNVERRVQVTDWGYRYSGWYSRGGVDVYQYDEGTIVIDFVDAKTTDLIYRSTVRAEVNRENTSFEKRQERITTAVEKILEDFPPNTKK